jgi:carbamoyltransferase
MKVLRVVLTPFRLAMRVARPFHALRSGREARVDGTGRLQTVHRETNPRYHALIETFGRATGMPVVLNTSFNLRGEPITNTPAEAFSTFMASGMDTLVRGDHVVDKRAVAG